MSEGMRDLVIGAVLRAVSGIVSTELSVAVLVCHVAIGVRGAGPWAVGIGTTVLVR